MQSKIDDTLHPTPYTLLFDIAGVRTRILKGGSGPPLIYWHGAGCGMAWHPHHTLLAEHFTVYAPDHPGWGGSDNPEWDDIQDFVLHYDAVFRTLGLQQPALVGHSLGGWLAAAFAVTYPERLAALALVNAAGLPFDTEPVPDFFAAAARGGPSFAQLIFHKMEVAAAYFPAQPTQEDHLRSFRELTATARLAWDRWFDDKLPRRLGRLLCPALVLWGEHDRLFPPELGRKYAEAIPGARFQTLPDCGHMAPFEDPATFTQAIVQFYQESQHLNT